MEKLLTLRQSQASLSMSRAKATLKASVLVIFLVSFMVLYYTVNDEASAGREVIKEDSKKEDVGRSPQVLTVNSTEHKDKPKSPSFCNENFLGNPYDVVKELRDLIVGLTNLVSNAIIQQLERTLNSTTADLPALLRNIKGFQKLQRCDTCSKKQILTDAFIGTNSSIQTCGYWNGYRLPVIGVNPIGRLGNVMGEYASLLAIGEIFNVTAVLTTDHQGTLLKYFPHLSLPAVEIGLQSDWMALPEEKHFHPFYGGLQLAALGLLGSKKFLSTGYPFEMSLFNAHRDKIRQEFRFTDEIVNKAQHFLSQVAENSARNRTDKAISFIGVHIRMTDYMKQITDGYGAAPVDYEPFVARAAKYYESKLGGNLVFIVTSDDIQHAKKIFQNIGQRNVFFSEDYCCINRCPERSCDKPQLDGPLNFTSSPSGNRTIFTWFPSKDLPGEDMALLAQCNHSIITLGSYGFWTGYLSQGLVLYPDVKTKKLYPFSRPFYEEAKLDNFIPIEL